ncbi:RNA polymerase sigma-70 factor (ECF subfamily) [Anaerotaenia torta]
MLSGEDMDGLMIQISKKDMDALQEFYMEMNKAVYGLAYVITKSPYDAEDIMQSTFIKIWDKAYQYRPSTNAKAWTMKIARNLALTKLKDSKRFVELNTELPSEDAFMKTIHLQELNTLLSALKKDEREIVILYSAGFSHKEISDIVKKPYSTVRWKYSNAINKLTVLEREGNYERA